MNIIIILLCVSVILLLLKRSKDRGAIVIDPTTFSERKRSMNFLPWIHQSPKPVEGEIIVHKSGMTKGEKFLTTLASFCAIVMCILELLDRLMPLLKG